MSRAVSLLSKQVGFIGAIAGILFAALPLAAAEIQGHPDVTDGDTLEIRGETMRLKGIDAPESAQTCRRPNRARWPCGQEATQALEKRIDGAAIHCTWQARGGYGRAIATCYEDGVNLNAWMVRSGWALAYREYSQAYVEQERQAKRADAGIWQGDFVPPWDWRDGECSASSTVSGSATTSWPVRVDR